MAATCLLVFAALAWVPLSAAEPAGHDMSYTMTLESDMTMKVRDSKQRIQSTTIFEYRRTQLAKTVTVYQRSEYLKILKDGELAQEAISNKDKFFFKTPNEEKEVLLKDHENAVFRKHMKRKFTEPLFVAIVDENGATTRIKAPKDDYAANAQKKGTFEGFQLFHVAFFKDKDSWEQTRGIAAHKGPAMGVLTYQKQKAVDEAPNLVPVVVSGSLSIKDTAPNGDEITLVYGVSGTQIFDSKSQTWVSGKLEMKISTTTSEHNAIPVDFSGTLTVSLKEVMQK